MRLVLSIGDEGGGEDGGREHVHGIRRSSDGRRLDPSVEATTGSPSDPTVTAVDVMFRPELETISVVLEMQSRSARRTRITSLSFGPPGLPPRPRR
jgi:hypothetical protein